ncbi:MAG: HAMP domain-containing protein, partial [Anaerolineaceae bacterium]|nr:HAMP domain-containing protein [Anaerolineaceae bacterium]
MDFIFGLVSSFPYLNLPPDISGWVSWVILLTIVLVLGGFRYRSLNQKMEAWHWLFFGGVLLAVPLTSLFFGVQLPENFANSIPGVPMDIGSPKLMFFTAIPWMLGTGILGPFYGIIIGLITGLLTAFWRTHNIYSIVYYAGTALLFGVFIFQRYRPLLYRFIRHPLAAAVLVGISFAPINIFMLMFEISGGLAARFDYALNHALADFIVSGGELLIAGAIMEIFSFFNLGIWGGSGRLLPSPDEKSLIYRILYGITPILFLAFFMMIIIDWRVSGKAAGQMVEDRLSSISQVAAEGMPYFFETGQNLILEMANDELFEQSREEASLGLLESVQKVPFFTQLILIDKNGDIYSAYPSNGVENIKLSPEEISGFSFAMNGVLIQTYPIFPINEIAQISFISVVKNEIGEEVGVLIGRTNLLSNPFTQPVIQALNSVNEYQGKVFILDENRRILYHNALPGLISDEYTGPVHVETPFTSELALEGPRDYVFQQQIKGRPWIIILKIPAEISQKLVLDIALPLLMTMVIITILLFGFWIFIIIGIIRSLRSLAENATQISEGQLDKRLGRHGVDEIGQFAAAFEQMRLSLKDRIDELSSLLDVSKGVATSLESEKALTPLLDAALKEGAQCSRVVLKVTPTSDPGSSQLTAAGEGVFSEKWAYLDSQLFTILGKQNTFTVSNTVRLHYLNFIPDSSPPGAIHAESLYHEKNYYGVFWVAYDKPHVFTQEEKRFFSTLAGYAALAASNAKLYAASELGRQRLEAVIESSPEPILVMDEYLRLLLLNQAAKQVDGLIANSTPGTRIEEAIQNKELVEMLLQPDEKGHGNHEMSTPDGTEFFTSISSVMDNGRILGKICIMRDITQFKELDKIKSDFVSTVSHDIRSPLTLIGGYAHMLEMFGNLNDEQLRYVNSIRAGVNSMNTLVTNLLDLGRIESGIALKLSTVSCLELTLNVLNTLKPKATQNQVQLKLLFSKKDDVIIQADAALVQQALFNLIDNAIKFSKIGGSINVFLRSGKDASIVFEVRDEGRGISPVDLPHIFEKFYRSKQNDDNKTKGTGLGLAIVKTIAERHGGEVWAESKLGSGSSFFLGLPLKPDAKFER